MNSTLQTRVCLELSVMAELHFVARFKKIEAAAVSLNFQINLARPEGFEPPTPWFVAKYSIQMSYGRKKGVEL